MGSWSTGESVSSLMVEEFGVEDFVGLKNYQPGAPLKHVAWKHYARGRGMHQKEYSDYVDRRIWLDWDYFAGMPKESRLSRLCYWVLEISKTTDEYGLRIPGVTLQPARGEDHKRKVLEALALFEVNRNDSLESVDGDDDKAAHS